MAEIICLVCGLSIKKDNYNVNENGRLAQNLYEDIKCCPFCGVDKRYLSKDGNPYYKAIHNLSEEETTIIDHAMKLEVFNASFYKKASMMALDEKLKNMFNDLAKIEFMHAAVHKKVGGFKEFPILKELDYSSLDKDELLIEAANKREKHAVAYYDKYSAKVLDKNIYIILNALREVEKEHIEMTI